MVAGRALHYVLKVADRTATAHFYRNILGMKVLRHEEFSEGCEAQCNGPYANRWSKTMVGYGPEDTHFVVELTYNYGVTSYEKGNDFLGMVIRSAESVKRAQDDGWPVGEEDGLKVLEAPGGYKFYIIDELQPAETDPVVKVKLACSNIEKTTSYWNGLLDKPIDRAAAYGRIAFSCPFAEQEGISSKMTAADQKILTPLISLDTPGKATVRVIILADPDGHEICFVDDEAFRQLSQVDPKGDELLTRYIKLDKSRE